MPADQARDRRDVDDRAAAALEQREPVLAAEERAVEIDREDAAARSRRSVSSILPSAAMPAALTRPSSRPCAAADLGDHAQPIKLGGHIERMADAGAAGQIAGDGDAAFDRHRCGDRRADCARRAGDQNDLVVQPVHAAPRQRGLSWWPWWMVVMVMIMVMVVSDDHADGRDGGDRDRDDDGRDGAGARRRPHRRRLRARTARRSRRASRRGLPAALRSPDRA